MCGATGWAPRASNSVRRSHDRHVGAPKPESNIVKQYFASCLAKVLHLHCGFPGVHPHPSPTASGRHPTQIAPPRVQVAACFLHMHNCCARNKNAVINYNQLGCETCMAHLVAHWLQASAWQTECGPNKQKNKSTPVPCQPAHSAKSRGIHPITQCICKPVQCWLCGMPQLNIITACM